VCVYAYTDDITGFMLVCSPAESQLYFVHNNININLE